MQSRCVIMFLILFYAASAGASPAVAVPFDEETLDEIGELNRAITDHYEQLISRTRTLDAEREASSSRIEAIESDLSEIERERADVERLAPDAEPALRMIEEHRIEAKSRYLEALAEKHVLDLEVMRSFEVHGAAILSNLERLALALEDSGRVEDGSESPGTRSGFRSLQQGTAVALSVLEDWGALTRDDPRFRALWATSRVLNRNLRSLKASDGIRATVELVRERSFVVRSLIDQARALRAALDQQGLLLQVAAQNQMLRLHFTRLGAINGLELPDLDLEDSTRRILEDIEQETLSASTVSDFDPLGGFDDCLHRGICK